jgi:uncharacterized protein (DUF4415 family)
MKGHYMTKAKRTKHKRWWPHLTEEEEEAKVKAGIAADPDNPEWTREDFARAKPAHEVLPPSFFEAVKRLPGQRGKQKAPTKELVTMRLDRAVVDHFKKGGEGWRARINAALKRIVDAA